MTPHYNQTITTQIPQEYTSSQFSDGCAEASSLRLPPGIAPYTIRLEHKGQFHLYRFDHRIVAGDETAGWTYKRQADGPHDYLTILND